MKTLIIGERYKEKFGNSLVFHGFTPFWLSENPNIDYRLASHADLSIFIHDKNAILASYLAENVDLVKTLTKRGYNIVISNYKQSAVYPDDINLCAVQLGDRIIHNRRHSDPEIISMNLEFINVNQGYTRCTALTIDDNCIITSDRGIADSALKAGVEVLLIDEGAVELEGYSIGFIGGASFKTEDTIYFTGDIETHPSASYIKELIFKHGFKICCLTDGPLVDIGGAVYIK